MLNNYNGKVQQCGWIVGIPYKFFWQERFGFKPVWNNEEERLASQVDKQPMNEKYNKKSTFFRSQIWEDGGRDEQCQRKMEGSRKDRSCWRSLKNY